MSKLSMVNGRIVIEDDTPKSSNQNGAANFDKLRQTYQPTAQANMRTARPNNPMQSTSGTQSGSPRLSMVNGKIVLNDETPTRSTNWMDQAVELVKTRAAQRENRTNSGTMDDARRQQWAIDNANLIDQASSRYEGPTRIERRTSTGLEADEDTGRNIYDNDFLPTATTYEGLRTVRNENYNPLPREERDALIDEWGKALSGNVAADEYQRLLYNVTKNGGIEQLIAEQNADAANDRDYGRKLRGVDLDSMSAWDRITGTIGNTVSGAGKQIASSGVGLVASGLNRAANAATQDDSLTSYKSALEQAARAWYNGLVNGADEPETEESIRQLASYVGGDDYAEAVVRRVRERAATADSDALTVGLLDDIQPDENKIWENSQRIISDAGIYDTINSLNEGAARDIQYAKDINLIQGQFGDNLVEAGVSAIQNIADAALAVPITMAAGPGALAMLPFAFRAYGGSYAEQMQDATQYGQLVGQDAARRATQNAGLSSAIEVGTEMMWGMVGAMSKVTGGGALDEVAQNKLSEAISGWARTEAGRKTLQFVGEKALGGVTEGLEEVVGAAAEQILKNVGVMSGDPMEWDELKREMAHSFITGALGGLMGEITGLVSTPMQWDRVGNQVRSGMADVTVDELVDLANAEGMENTSLAHTYADLFKGVPRSIDSFSDREIGRLYESYQATMERQIEAAERIDSTKAKLESGEELSRADVNRLTNNPAAVRILTDTGAINEEALSGNITERTQAVEMALRALANDSMALSEAQAENVQTDPGNANTAVSAPNPFLVMNRNAINNVVQQAGPLSAAESIRAEANAENRLMGNVLRSAARVADTAERLGVSQQAGDLMSRMYDPGQDAVEYTGEMTKYYNQGKEGKTFDVGSIEGVSAIQAQAAFNAGRQEYIERSNNGEEGLRVRTSSERQNSQSAGGSVGVLEESTGAAQGRQAGSFQREGGNARVSAESLRIEGAKAIERSGLRIVTNDSSVAAAKKYAEDRGVNFVAYAGGALNIDGVQSRGYYDSDTNTVYVRADHRLFTAEQIAKHETTHAQIHNGKITLGEVNRETVDFATVRDVLVNELGQERFDEMVDAYVEMYAGTNLSRQDVFEELICDSVAGMNDFVSVGHFEDALKYAPALKTAKAVTEENAANGTRAGPVGESENDGENWGIESVKQIVNELGDSGEYNSEAAGSFSRELDPDVLKKLNNGKTMKVYRSMQVIKGKLYPPMAAKIDDGSGKRKLVEPTVLNEWYKADEHPELLDENGKFKLDKANGSTLDVAYNPYWHTSNMMLNDQFSSAYNRKNLVTVECEIPVSELTSGYKAQFAKDAVGLTPWHSGPVASQLGNAGNQRNVYLSRWVKVNRIVPDSEVAKNIAKTLNGTGISVPVNTVTPSLRSEMEKIGVPISEASGLNKKAAARLNATLAKVETTFDAKTESAAPTGNFSRDTWNESEYVKEMDKAADALAAALDVSPDDALQYIKNVNSIAKMIAEDVDRWDYKSSPGRSSFVSNVEYGGSFDFSTLCKKRRLLTGTFTEIQKALPNAVLSPLDILHLRDMMKKEGLETSCGLCYVEGSRANMGQFTKEFIKLYQKYNPGKWVPQYKDMITPDGIEDVRRNHEEVYAEYEKFWNNHGKLRSEDPNLFASQQKPKLYQMRTAYNGEILKYFKKDGTIEEKNKNGGVRMQSFSDFEIVHLIDMMQIIMDMSRVGLAGQAYTKVPDFALALGNTGLKINLSLITKGVDANGKLIFDDREGMNHETAFKIRDQYSKNVGTILVTFTDEQLKAAMADDRIDFIIPFHRSQWKKSQYAAMGLPANTKDYTYQQNEKYLHPDRHTHKFKERDVIEKAKNFMPNTYWDFSKSGKENAEKYLEMCAKDDRRPKFYKLLQDNHDGSYSLKADGSTDGYWKLLIDFKMYDNEGVGSPQTAVRPDFNMDEAKRMMNDYEGGHESFPVARGIVDKFVKEYKETHKESKYSRDLDSAYMAAAESGDTETAAKLVKQAAEAAGYTVEGYHGTLQFGFTKIDRKKSDYNGPFFVTADINTARTYSTKDEVTNINRSVSVDEMEAEVEEKNKIAYNEAISFGTVLSEMAGIQGWADIGYIQESLNDIVEKYAQSGNEESFKEEMWTLFDNETWALFDAIHGHSSNGDDMYYRDDVDDYDEWIESDETKRLREALDEINDAYADWFYALRRYYDDSYAGNYHVYINPSNLFVLDCKGRQWNSLEGDGKILKETNYGRYWNTRSVGEWAEEHGYDGVLFHDVVDDGGRGTVRVKKPADVYALFNPQAQVKSADPITYDEDGNIIPLEDRFNPKNDDIRYSRDIDSAYMAAVESKDMKTARKMVQDAAIDAGAFTDGGKKPVSFYHGTSKDFTVFDAEKMGDYGTYGIGHYFADNKKIADDYGYKGHIIKSYLISDKVATKESHNITADSVSRFLEEYDLPFGSTIGRYTDSVEDWLSRRSDADAVSDLVEWARKYETGKTKTDTMNDIINILGVDAQYRSTGGGYTGYLIVYNNKTIKSAEPIVRDNNGNIIPLSERFNPKNDDIRYSRDLNSDGRQLTKGQQEFFKDSKVRDEQGRLLVLYHGTHSMNGFTVFENNGIVNGQIHGAGFYFTPNENVAKYWGPNVYKVYLNIKNPCYLSRKATPEIAVLVKEKLAKDYDYEIANWNPSWGKWFGADLTKDEYVEKQFNRLYSTMGEAISFLINKDDLDDTWSEGKFFGEIAKRETELMESFGYDGAVAEDGKQNEYVAFYPEQIKRVNNQKPTENPDIRFSRDLSNTELYEANRQLQKDLTELRSKLKTRTEQYKYWKGQTKTTEGRQLRIDDVTKLAREIINGQESSADAKAVAEKMKALGEYLLNSQDENVYDEARLKAYEVAHDILANAKTLNAKSGEDFYDDFRKALKNQPIYVAPSVREEVAPDGWNDFRKAQFGTFNMTADQSKGKSVDKVYHDLQATFGEWLLPEYITSEADQLNKILEVIETYRPVYENLNSYEMADAVEWTANEILTRIIGEEIRETNPTYADRMEKKLSDQKMKSQEALRRVREQRDRKVADLKEHYQQVAEDRRNRKIDSEMRSRLLKIAKRLNNKKLDRVTRGLLDQYIGELDLVSKGILGRTVKELETLQAWYDSYKESMGDDFIPDKFIERKIARLSKKHISDLTQEEVADLTTVLLNLETMIRTQNQLIESQIKMDAYAAGVQTIDDINNSNGRTGFLNKYISTETATPEREIHRITGYREDSPLYKAAKELSDGQRNMLDYQRRAEALFKKWTTEKKFIRRIAGKHAEEIMVSGYVNGELTNVKITPAMRMALYLHEKNDDNMRHISKGGVKIPDMALYKKGKLQEAYDKATRVVFTRGMLKEIASKMSADEKAFADAVDRYYNGMSRNEINDTSEALRGYAIAGVEHYYPIDTDGAFLKKEFDAIKRDGSIEGMGILKERIEGATNPIMLYDMNDTLNRSISQHSKYVGLAIPVRNFNKLYSVTTFNYETSVAETLKKNWGSAAISYIEKMMADVQNGTGLKSDAWGDLLARARSHYAGAVLNTNASVALKQAASYPTAAAVVGYGPLAKALADTKKIDLEKLAQYTPLLWYRSKGFSTTELGDIGKEGSHIPKVLNWIQKMDIATTTKLVKAAMYYVNENNNLARGTDAWWKEVANVYNRIIEETQPNYTMMQRPQILRSDNALTRALNMFKTQPFQNFNILYDAFGNLSAKSREYKANATAENLQALKSARTNAARAVSSQVVSAFVFALMQFAWDAFRGKDKKYKDDDDEMTLASWLKGMGINVLSSVGGMIPFGSYALELGETLTDTVIKVFGGQAFFDQKFYGLSENAAESVNDMGNALINMVTKAAQALEGGEVTESTVRSVVDSMADVAQFAGIPVNNVIKLAQAIGRNYYLATEGRYVGGYHALRLTTDPARYSSDYYDLLWKAYNNEKAAYDEVLQLMLNDGFEEDKIKSAMEKRMKDAQGVSSVKDLESRWMAPAQQQTYDKGLADLEQTTMFQAATDEQQQALITRLYNLALDNEAGKKLSAKIAGGADVGLDQTEYLLYTLALSMADQPTESGKYGSYTNDEVEAAILMVPGLSKQERAYLWEAAGKTQKSNPWR